MSTVLPSERRDDVLSLDDILSGIHSRRWWLVVSVVLFSILFVAAAVLMTPVYRASVVLISAGSDRSGLSSALNSALGQLGGLASLVGVGVPASDGGTQEALAVLRSREFNERFISEHNLTQQLFADRWDAEQQVWKTKDGRPPTPAATFRYFDGAIRTITEDTRTRLITLHIDWRDREAAAVWANELARRLNSEMRARAIEKAEASIGFLERELALTPVVETRAAINRLIEAQIAQRMLANVTEEYAFRVVDRAMPPDPDDSLRPRRLLWFVAGPIVGVLVGLFGVVIWLFFSPTKAAASLA